MKLHNIRPEHPRMRDASRGRQRLTD